MEDGATLYYAYRIYAFDSHYDVGIFTSLELAQEGCREHHRLYAAKMAYGYTMATELSFSYEYDDDGRVASANEKDTGGDYYAITPLTINQVVPYD